MKIPNVPISAVWPGEPYPRVTTWDGEGVNFALFSENATKVELCIFDPSGKHELQRITFKEQTDLIWHCFLPEARMLLAGDEIGRTQGGNNNAYCQDNEISWLDWTLAPERSDLLGFVERMLRIRREHAVFRRRNFFQGRPIRGREVKDVLWLNPGGSEMSDEEWNQSFARCLGLFLAGDALDETDKRGRRIVDDSFLILFNAHHETIDFHLPAFGGNAWLTLVDTTHDQGLLPYARLPTVSPYRLAGRSLVLLQEVREKP